MSTPMRVAAFVTVLAAAFAAAWGGGRLVGPLEAEPPAHAAEAGHGEGADGDAGHDGGHDAAGASAEPPGGLAVSSQGYTLALTGSRFAAGPTPVSFTITGPDGERLTDYEVQHEKRLHLIAVRRDLTGYQHVHPTLTPGGLWTTDLALSPGVWRLLADFVPFGGEGLTLGTDLVVEGRTTAAAAARERRTTQVDGYTVELVGDLSAGAAADVEVRVSRDGEPVTDLQPYLGASGHLVALREGDLAYLHVHPESGDAGPVVPFVAEVPSEGRYRFYFDFKHRGKVRTAELVASTSPDASPSTSHGEGSGHDH